MGEVDLAARMWKLPKERSKNDQAHDIPLSDPAVAILETLPRIGEHIRAHDQWHAPASELQRQQATARRIAAADMPRWWLHDLRRTVASGMARLGVNLPVIEKVLNHASGSFGGIVGVYQRHDFGDEKRHALERWGAHVADLVSGRHSENIVRLEPRV